MYQLLYEDKKDKYLYIENTNDGEEIYRVYTANFFKDEKEKNLSIEGITYKFKNKMKSMITDGYGWFNIFGPYNSISIFEYENINNNYEVVTAIKFNFKYYYTGKIINKSSLIISEEIDEMGAKEFNQKNDIPKGYKILMITIFIVAVIYEVIKTII